MKYLKPLGSVCYDETGITYPVKKELTWPSFIFWKQPHANLPEVITFPDDKTQDMLDFIESNNQDFNLLVVDSYWV